MRTSKLFNRFLSGVLVIGVGNLIGLGSTFLTRMIIGRYLGPSDYGLFALGFTILDIASLVALVGLHQAIAQQIPRTDSSNLIFKISVVLSTLASIIISLVIISNTMTISNILGEPDFASTLKIFGLILPVYVFIRITIGGFRGLEDSKSRVIIKSILFRGGGVVAIFVGSILGFGINSVIKLWSVPLVLSALIGFLMLYFATDLISNLKFQDVRTPRSIIIKNIISLVTLSLPLMLSQGIFKLVQDADTLLISYFMMGSDVGIYDSAFTIARGFTFFTATAGFLILPMISKLHSQDKINQMKKLYKLSTKWMIFGSFPVYILIIGFSENIISFIYGPEYVSGSVALIIVSTGFFIHILFGQNGEALKSIGASFHILSGSIIALSVNVIFNTVLIPRIGINGAAISSASSYLVVNVYWSYMLRKLVGIHPFNKRYVLPLIWGATLFYSIRILLDYVVYIRSYYYLVLTLSFVILYIIGIVLLGGVEEDEVELVRGWINR